MLKTMLQGGPYVQCTIISNVHQYYHLSISPWIGYIAGTGRQWLSKRCVGDNTVKLRQSPH